ncbi:MAG: recombinase family protein [Rhodospirillaceae bacterium]|nr:recombinase family protein [Rhodospirillaceae bacterium]
MASDKKQLVCAIYTRKSSEEGLEQGFNSLDAQREACEAYVRSQRHEGWKVLDTHYDDGGFSGGNMDRPGLVQLMADVRDHKVDVVVVYKVDRLTRSLSDFAKIVETFDGQGVSFVSVTQQFNTTNSMGRLTLNVLLSFALFEREVSAERVRDKIAASRRKGMWMGGNIPLGYDLQDHKLVINAAEADMVRTIFSLYANLKCVRRLKEQVEARGFRTKSWVSKSDRAVGGHPFTRGHLYYLLRNRVYLGEAVHRGSSNPGQHEAIIDKILWDQVQATLEANRIDRKNGKPFDNPSLLAGIIFDEKGNRLTPSHSGKKGGQYRYYVSQAVLQHEPGKAAEIKRVPASEIEGLVERQLRAILSNPGALVKQLFDEDCGADKRKAIVEGCAQLRKVEGKDEFADLMRALIAKVVVGLDRIEIALDRVALKKMLGVTRTGTHNTETGAHLIITVPVRIKRSGRPGKMLISEFGLDRPTTSINPSMVSAIVRAHKWNQQLISGKSITELAKQESVHRSYVGNTLPLVFLAPDITEAILDGRQPADLKVEQLLQSLPITWVEQRRALGFSAKPDQ